MSSVLGTMSHSSILSFTNYILVTGSSLDLWSEGHGFNSCCRWTMCRFTSKGTSARKRRNSCCFPSTCTCLGTQEFLSLLAPRPCYEYIVEIIKPRSNSINMKTVAMLFIHFNFYTNVHVLVNRKNWNGGIDFLCHIWIWHCNNEIPTWEC